ncbi:MAG: hypothetical protein JW894_14965 [Bacteroidales bacterium]|nr:hypothetical protein [Bacteroidales bacterium]
MRLFFGLLLISVLCRYSYADNDSANFVMYNPEFEFKEGIFVNFSQVQNNSPLPKSRIVTDIDYDNPEFFDYVLSKSKIFYYDNIGNKNELKSNKVWGYSRNGFLYINIDDGFFRITLIGSVCHFIASQTTYNSYYNSPYYYNSYYYDPYRMPSSYPSTEMRQYLLDFKTGRVFDYNEESLEVILMQDPELHDEYAALSKKKKRQQKFIFMRKYNERNPLYFPKN